LVLAIIFSVYVTMIVRGAAEANSGLQDELAITLVGGLAGVLVTDVLARVIALSVALSATPPKPIHWDHIVAIDVAGMLVGLLFSPLAKKE